MHWDRGFTTINLLPGPRRLFLHTTTHTIILLSTTQTQPSSHNPLRAAPRGRNTFYAVSVARVIQKRHKHFAIAQPTNNAPLPPTTNHIPRLSCTETLPESRSSIHTSNQLPSGHGTHDEPPRDK
ncbi:uncharacterized protein CCOS01_11245 [Colletotrichum costaricense]|uniref:Uncharacterized protein n=2 Tax=Colletotrichum acutatum species complex TaxID=2707335 RepID=A0AAJ0DXL6_9PEZI|nr:uncharacterized protein CCOS01_11245 [Colletotrichum costaricense]XP_060381203.1 uncharacterized protein CTAM01_08016 [Colletotrichum tamarilloi]KAK1497004.1 hypothetical protein CTAM01_08016 [Colletotrichum tamarilloi]KAK1519594.1 hypothetical protein CCOS01_11245 [Colletotrichum costaricense]